MARKNEDFILIPFLNEFTRSVLKSIIKKDKLMPRKKRFIVQGRPFRPLITMPHPVPGYRQSLSPKHLAPRTQQPMYGQPQRFPPRNQMPSRINPLSIGEGIGTATPKEMIMPDLTKPLPPGFDLGKLNMFLPDQRISMIECPGPGKYIIVRSRLKSNMTNIVLTEQEIREVVEKFSFAAKIPIIGGLFKAAVGNLVMIALISDFVGSRFIITKASPYMILEQQRNQAQTRNNFN
ncbi:MAG: hypothetical protein ABIH72_02450 [archaeon]